jgi:hypothetical protein
MRITRPLIGRRWRGVLILTPKFLIRKYIAVDLKDYRDGKVTPQNICILDCQGSPTT